MLNKDLQQFLQEFPDDMEVIFINGLRKVVTEVCVAKQQPTTVKEIKNDRIICNHEDMICLKGVTFHEYYHG